MSDPTRPEPDPARADAAWSRVLQHADRLFEAIDALDDAGGIGAVAGRLRPKTLDRATATLRAVRESVDAQLRALKAARSGPRKPPSDVA